MNLSLANCFVTVQDPDEALTFYRDALGLELRNDVAAEGFRWLTLSPPAQPDVEIVLVQPHAGHSQDDGDALATLLAKGSLPGVNFRTPDLDTTFEKVRASGAEVLQEPMDQFWGARDCAFRDPSGNMVRIGQQPASGS
jgi:catechol 2,3-dioxygenase-like lactoylglutathione lyase family enzyme